MSDPDARVYEDDAGGWRWRLLGGNGEIVAISSEAYTRKADAQRGLDDAARLLAVATGVTLTVDNSRARFDALLPPDAA